MNKKFRDVFIAFKKDELSIVVYPYKETSWQMDKFTLGTKLSKKFPTHTQTIKVLSLLNLPFFYDALNNQIKVIKKELNNYEEIAQIYVKYTESIIHNLPIDEVIFEYAFHNDYKFDAELILPLVESLKQVEEIV